MENNKTSILEILFMFGVFVLFAALAVVGWTKAQTGPALIGSAVALLCLWILISDLRKGVRAPTHYEWFKAWMNMRPVIIGFGGIGLMVLAAQFVFPVTKEWPEPIKVVLVLTPVLVWAGAVFYSMWRAPWRHESDTAYKRRVGYKNQPKDFS